MINFLSFFRIFCLFLMLLVGVGSINACRSSRKNTHSTPANTTDLLTKKMGLNQLNSPWLSASLDVTAGDSKQEQSFSADMRLRTDSALWLSVYPNFGIKIEVARALITRDSVKVLDRFNKKYYVYGIDYLQRLTGYPLNFDLLQRVIVGSRLIDAPPTALDTLPNGAGFLLKSEDNTLHENVHIQSPQNTIKQIVMEDYFTEKILTIDFDDYQPLQQLLFARKRQVNIKSKTIYKANISFDELNIGKPLEMPFAVSGKYSRVE